MFRPRIIPVLLLRNKGLVKSIKFRDHRYIGDPINAVKIFNDLRSDEVVFLDILASNESRTISLEFVKNVGEEANMPFAAGGGITTLEQIKAIIAAGAEKIVINTKAACEPEFIRNASETFGSSTIVVCIDVKKIFNGKEQTWIFGGKKPTRYEPVEFAQLVEEKGAGEIIIQSIERDGTMKGYDIQLIRRISSAVKIPVIALGGAGNIIHMKQAYREGYANGLAAGSMFVYHGARNGILINYPEKEEISKSFVE
jgi:imidazole glycerol-phosphate synthase subunit HisF